MGSLKKTFLAHLNNTRLALPKDTVTNKTGEEELGQIHIKSRVSYIHPFQDHTFYSQILFFITNKVAGGKHFQPMNKYYVAYDLLAKETEETNINSSTFLRKFDKHNATSSETSNNQGNIEWKHSNRIK